ncbi:MAG: hypothetical protein GY811_21065 [Myxococcales bacterium]|nr:hypothetical protein [Myxococcales bacterium]
MREISRALQSDLASSADWSSALALRLAKLKALIENPTCAPNAFEVAQVFEHCVADREGAVAGYVLCYRADSRRLDALARARAISVEVGDFATTARLSRLQYKQDANPWHLADEGVAWLDAGQPDRAVKPLMAASRKLPDSDYVNSALRTARREWPSVRHEVARLMQKADAAETYEEASDSVLQAARMLRMLQTNPISLEKLLLASLKHDPENASALGLLEQRLSHVEDRGAIMEVYEDRLATRDSLAERVEELRRAGMCMYRNVTFRVLGVRLVHRALQVAYKGKLSEIPGHLAMISVLRQHYEHAGHVGKLLEIIEKALDLPLPEIDLQFLALQGLDLTLHQLKDEESARAYADLASGFVSNHPLVAEARGQRLVGQADFSLPMAVPVTDANGAVFLDSVAVETPAPMVGQPESLRDQLSTAANSQATTNSSHKDFPLVGRDAADGLPESLDLEHLPEHVPAAEEFGLVELPEAPLEAKQPLKFQQQAPQDFIELSEAEPIDFVDLEEVHPETEPIDFVDLDEEESLDFVELEEPQAEPAQAVEPVQPPAPVKPPTPVKPAEPVRGPQPVASRVSKRPSDIEVGWFAAGAESARQPAPESAPPAKATLGKISLIPRAAMSALKRAGVERNKLPADAQHRAPRLAMPISIEFQLGEERSSALTRELSLTGAYLITSVKIPLMQMLELAVQIPISCDSMRSETMLIRAKVVRAAVGGYGVAFDAPSDEFKTRLTELMSQQ